MLGATAFLRTFPSTSIRFCGGDEAKLAIRSFAFVAFLGIEDHALAVDTHHFHFLHFLALTRSQLVQISNALLF